MSIPWWKPYIVAVSPKDWVIGPRSGHRQPLACADVGLGFGATLNVAELPVFSGVPSEPSAPGATSSRTWAPLCIAFEGSSTRTVSSSAQAKVPTIGSPPTTVALNARSVDQWSMAVVNRTERFAAGATSVQPSRGRKRTISGTRMGVAPRTCGAGPPAPRGGAPPATPPASPRPAMATAPSRGIEDAAAGGPDAATTSGPGEPSTLIVIRDPDPPDVAAPSARPIAMARQPTDATAMRPEWRASGGGGE